MNTGVLCERTETARALAEIPGIDRIYSYEFPFKEETGAEWIQLLPYVFRMENVIEPDPKAAGVLIRNYDELGFLRSAGYDKEIIADSCLYTMNSGAVSELREAGVSRTTCPLELNFRELRERGAADISELVIYGRAPLMISANCVRKMETELCKFKRGSNPGSNMEANTGEYKLCKPQGTRSQSVEILTDRKGADFPVLCDCTYCYNVIYNSVPTSLHRDMDRVRQLGLSGVRIDITTEDAREAEQIVKCYVNLIEKDRDTESLRPSAFTHGHFKNGVE